MSASATDLLYAVAAAGGLMALMAAAGFIGDWLTKTAKRRRSGRKKAPYGRE